MLLLHLQEWLQLSSCQLRGDGLKPLLGRGCLLLLLFELLSQLLLHVLLQVGQQEGLPACRASKLEMLAVLRWQRLLLTWGATATIGPADRGLVTIVGLEGQLGSSTGTERHSMACTKQKGPLWSPKKGQHTDCRVSSSAQYTDQREKLPPDGRLAP